MIVTAEDVATLPRDLVLVGGCFDPLHAGHLDYFDKARVFGPVCVAVASDAYIRECKGRPPLLPQETRMAVLDALSNVDFVMAQDETGEAGILEDVRPKFYAKGKDWSDRLPEAELKALEQFGIPFLMLDSKTDSSTDRLMAFQQELDAMAVQAFEQNIHRQVPASTPWTPVTDYSLEARRIAEGIHPQLIKDVFQPTRMLDVGCGHGHLMTMLEEIGVRCRGVDVNADPKWVVDDRMWQHDITAPLGPDWLEDLSGDYLRSDLVLCREVLEHLTIAQIARAVRNIVRLSKKYVYVTTRFHPDPAHMLDVTTEFDVDPTHITCLSKPFLRALFVLEGCTSRHDLEARMDHKGLGRCLVFEVA